jgi:glycosyltransferase involved in cell wall biosynthesis
MRPDPRISIIIDNYNYGRFLDAAIESALGQDWGNVEVIVVDDGSTDESPEVIARYADRVKAIRKANGGQGSAFNVGFQHSTGQLVILLDADDILYPARARRVIERYRPGVSKIQCQLDTIDGAGRNLHLPFPNYPSNLTAEEIRRRTLKFGYYPCAPASGNVYTREYLSQVMPIPDAFRYNADGYLNLHAPLYGDVETIPEALGAYRVHGANNWARSDVAGKKYATSIGYDLLLRGIFLGKAAALGHALDERSLPFTKNHLENRLLSLRLAPPQHPVSGDSPAKLARLGIKSAWIAPDVTLLGRFLWIAWFLLLGFLPRRAVIYLVKRFRLQNSRTRIAFALISLSRRRSS